MLLGLIPERPHKELVELSIGSPKEELMPKWIKRRGVWKENEFVREKDW